MVSADLPPSSDIRSGWCAVIGQMADGIAIALGVVTFIAGAVLTVIGDVATYKLVFLLCEPFIKPGAHNWDMGLLYTLLPLTLIVTGPGRWSLWSAMRLSRPHSL